MEAKLLLCVLLLALALPALAQEVKPEAGLLAGVARVDITAPLQQFPTVSLGGFGDRQGKPATSVHDPMYCRTVVLVAGGQKVALVATELLMIAPGMKEALLKELAKEGYRADNLLLAATHSHSSPECLHPGGDAWPLAFGKFHPAFYAWMVGRLAECVRQADANLQPAQLGFASAPLQDMNRNRRETGGDLVDPALTVMKVTTRGVNPQRTLALVSNFTAHPTMVGSDSFAISGEWPGAMSRELETKLGQGIALFFNGAQGDQTTSGDYGSGWERVAAYGKAMAGLTAGLAGKVKLSAEVTLAVSGRDWLLPPQQVSPAFMQSTGEEYEMTPEAAKQLLGKLFPPKVRMQAIRVGEGLFMAIPGEAIVELGLAMKRDSTALGAKFPMAIGLADDYVGYILSSEQYRQGGYESGTSFYGPELGTQLVGEMKETVRPLYAHQP